MNRWITYVLPMLIGVAKIAVAHRQIVAERQKTKQLSMLKRRKNHIFQRLQST